jgi:hypothetical protein
LVKNRLQRVDTTISGAMVNSALSAALLGLLVLVIGAWIASSQQLLRHSDDRRRHYMLHDHILGTVPEIFIIGAAKCGTTSLHELLSRHPDICSGGMKEKHFFDEPAEMFKGGFFAMQNYRESFRKDSKSCKYFIDSTPAYIRGTAIDNMNVTFSPTALSQKKFILLLREPAERECSWYQHFARGCISHVHSVFGRNPERLSWPRKEICKEDRYFYCYKLGCFNGTTDITRENYRREVMLSFANYYKLRGHSLFYHEQISRWLRFVRREQLFIVSFRALIEDTGAIMKNLTVYLNISSNFFGPSVQLPKENVNDVKEKFPCDCVTLDAWHTEFERTRTVEQTVQLINMPDRHPLEPPFPTSTFLYRRKCDEI